jgi:hypothetical protein
LHQRRPRTRIERKEPALARKREVGRDSRLGVDLGAELIENGVPLDTDGRNRRGSEFVGAQQAVAGSEREQGCQGVRNEPERKTADSPFLSPAFEACAMIA